MLALQEICNVLMTFDFKVNDVPKVWPLTLFTLYVMVNVELRSKEC